jgi:hypothetical protein
LRFPLILRLILPSKQYTYNFHQQKKKKMKNTLSVISAFLLMTNLGFAQKKPKIGVELGSAGVDLNAQSTAQSLANALSASVTYTYDERELAGRIFYEAGIDNQLGYEIGVFRTASFDATYVSGANRATESYTMYGLDGFATYKFSKDDNGAFVKGGAHWSRVDGNANVRLGSATASVSAYSYGVNVAGGVGYDWNNFRVSWTYYNNIGNDEGADMNFVSVGYKF